jgi:hypothetical protein
MRLQVFEWIPFAACRARTCRMCLKTHPKLHNRAAMLLLGPASSNVHVALRSPHRHTHSPSRRHPPCHPAPEGGYPALRGGYGATPHCAVWSVARGGLCRRRWRWWPPFQCPPVQTRPPCSGSVWRRRRTGKTPRHVMRPGPTPFRPATCLLGAFVTALAGCTHPLVIYSHTRTVQYYCPVGSPSCLLVCLCPCVLVSLYPCILVSLCPCVRV